MYLRLVFTEWDTAKTLTYYFSSLLLLVAFTVAKRYRTLMFRACVLKPDEQKGSPEYRDAFSKLPNFLDRHCT